MEPLYRVWISMKQRCGNPNDTSYKYYGARGIRVCDEWWPWEGFRDWAKQAGYVYGLTIDRVDPDGNYEPNNCEWVSASENSRRVHAARRVEYDWTS